MISRRTLFASLAAALVSAWAAWLWSMRHRVRAHEWPLSPCRVGEVHKGENGEVWVCAERWRP
jgi:hypothetical protein